MNAEQARIVCRALLAGSDALTARQAAIEVVLDLVTAPVEPKVTIWGMDPETLGREYTVADQHRAELLAAARGLLSSLTGEPSGAAALRAVCDRVERESDAGTQRLPSGPREV
jgi:hypothetical protein